MDLQHPPVAKDLLPLSHVDFYILVALADQERHGYGIMRDVAEQTEGAVQIGPGTLYGAIKRLLESGLIQESQDRPDPELDDQRRRYYRLTTLGRRVAALEANRLSRLLARAQSARLLDHTSAAGGGE